MQISAFHFLECSRHWKFLVTHPRILFQDHSEWPPVSIFSVAYYVCSPFCLWGAFGRRHHCILMTDVLLSCSYADIILCETFVTKDGAMCSVTFPVCGRARGPALFVNYQYCMDVTACYVTGAIVSRIGEDWRIGDQNAVSFREESKTEALKGPDLANFSGELHRPQIWFPRAQLHGW